MLAQIIAVLYARAVNEALLDPFRHNAWATRELLALCRPLSDEQLEATTPGTYGDIRATFHHVIESEAYYLGLLSGSRPDWYREDDEELPPPMEELERRAADVEERWERFLAGSPVDPERPIVYEDWASDAGVIIAQVLNHGSEHRAQVYTVLTTLGVEPPELDGWSYGEAHGRYRET